MPAASFITTPFVEALRRLDRPVLPTQLDSAALAQLDRSVLERGFFSARNIYADVLERTRDLVTDLLAPRTVTRPDRITADNPTGAVTIGENRATARLELKRAYAAAGYEPDPAERGTLKDLSSDVRINLVLDHNAHEAAGYGDYLQGQEPTVLDAFPCQELVRFEEREVPRDWIQRWREAGGTVYEGRLIARKDDDIWVAISRFGSPWPPFDFNSGMGLRDVSREEAVALGVIEINDQITPGRRAFNDQLALGPQ